MAFTQGVARLDSHTGKCAVFLVDPANPEDDAPALAPLSYLTRTLFHSDLDYLEAYYDQTVTLTFPSLASTVVERTHALPAHGAGVVPWGFMSIGGVVADGAYLAQSSGYQARWLELDVTENGVEIYERVYRDVSATALSALTLTIRVVLLRVAPAVAGADAFTIDPQAGFIQFGHGKFSTDGFPKLRVTAGVPVAWFPAVGPSIESSGAGLRIVRPDGSLQSLYGYAGTFLGSGGYKVTL